MYTLCGNNYKRQLSSSFSTTTNQCDLSKCLTCSRKSCVVIGNCRCPVQRLPVNLQTGLHRRSFLRSGTKAAFVFITGAEHTGQANNPQKRLMPRLSSRNSADTSPSRCIFLLLSPTTCSRSQLKAASGGNYNAVYCERGRQDYRRTYMKVHSSASDARTCFQKLLELRELAMRK